MDFTFNVFGYDEVLQGDLNKSVKALEELADKDLTKLFNTVPYSGDLKAEFQQQLESGNSVYVEFSYGNKSCKISFINQKKTTTRSLNWS